MLATEPFNPTCVTYPAAIGRDSKIVRVGMQNNRDREDWILGYLNLYQRRFDTWTASPVIAQRYAAVIRPAIIHGDLATLNDASAGYILAPPALGAVNTIAAAPGVIVHRNLHAKPLAYFRDAAHRIDAVKVLAFTPSSVFITVDAPSAGDVIVTQQMSSGWRVEVDGVRAAANESALFRTVHI